jgi:hypothetical protein
MKLPSSGHCRINARGEICFTLSCLADGCRTALMTELVGDGAL